MSEIIKQINVDGVDYDIVSEPAEKKIAELEKNNTALASVEFGTRNAKDDPVKVKFGGPLVNLDSDTDIYIGQDVYLGGGAVVIGSDGDCPIKMSWTHTPSFVIKGGYERDEIAIGSDAIRYNGVVVGGGGGGSSSMSGVDIRDGMQIRLSEAAGLCFGTDINSAWDTGLIGTGMQITMYNDELSIAHNPSRFSLRISSDRLECNGTNLLTGAGGSGSGNLPVVESHDGTELNLGTESCSIIAVSGTGYDLQIGTGVFIGSDTCIGRRVAIGYPRLGDDADYNIQIGTSIQGDEKLHIKGPVFLEATTHPALTIGTNGEGCLKIAWEESDKIVFTNLKSGKKATLELS